MATPPSTLIKSLVSLSIPECEVRSTGILGFIQYVDYFGNLITNIPGVLVEGKSWSVRVGDEMIPGSYTYSDRTPGAILALVGSHGWVEVAVNCGNAKLRLQLDWLDQLVVVFG